MFTVVAGIQDGCFLFVIFCLIFFAWLTVVAGIEDGRVQHAAKFGAKFSKFSALVHSL